MSVVKLPKMTEEEINDFIEKQTLCRIAFRGERYPYIAPFQYVTIDGTMYFHFTNYGKKMKMITADSRACVEVERYSPDLEEYKFVSLRGELEIVEDQKERTKGIMKLMEKGRESLSKNFLWAHGIHPSEDWSSLNPEKPLVLVRLSKVVEKVGLKSP